jgi:hypothetical protein
VQTDIFSLLSQPKDANEGKPVETVEPIDEEALPQG